MYKQRQSFYNLIIKHGHVSDDFKVIVIRAVMKDKRKDKEDVYNNMLISHKSWKMYFQVFKTFIFLYPCEIVVG